MPAAWHNAGLSDADSEKTPFRFGPGSNLGHETRETFHATAEGFFFWYMDFGEDGGSAGASCFLVGVPTSDAEYSIHGLEARATLEKKMPPAVKPVAPRHGSGRGLTEAVYYALAWLLAHAGFQRTKPSIASYSAKPKSS